MTRYSDTHLMMLEKGEISCQDVAEALCDYADGDLPKSVRARIEAHTDCCDCCRVELQSYMLTVELAGMIREPSFGENEHRITDDVRERLRRALEIRLNVSLPEA